MAQACSKSTSKRRYLLQGDQEVNWVYLAGAFMSSVLQPYKLSNEVGSLLLFLFLILILFLNFT